MNARMTMTTGLVAVMVVALAACGTDEEPGGNAATPSPNASESTSESAPAPAPSDSAGTPEATTDLVGEWQDPKADWTVRFNSDGSFTEDFEGVTDFRVGTYSLKDGVVSLEGDDGNTDRGTVDGTTLTFRLGSLQRM